MQNIECETLGTLEQMFRSDGFDIESINAQNDPLPPSANGYSAIVILGGPMAVYDNLAYLQQEQSLIKDAMKNKIPVLGICLGSQLIAHAAGGRVYKGKKKEIGWHVVSLTADGRADIFNGIPGRTMRVFQWHGDTYDLPPNATVLAYSDLYPQAFRIGSAVGIQFHLEVDKRLIQRWIQEYSNEVEAEKIDPKEILPRPIDMEQLSNKCRQVYSNFVKTLTLNSK